MHSFLAMISLFMTASFPLRHYILLSEDTPIIQDIVCISYLVRCNRKVNFAPLFSCRMRNKSVVSTNKDKKQAVFLRFSLTNTQSALSICRIACQKEKAFCLFWHNAFVFIPFENSPFPEAARKTTRAGVSPYPQGRRLSSRQFA